MQHQAWDWADALTAATRLDVLSGSGRFNVRPSTVRALLAFQKGCCALSGVPLLVPDVSRCTSWCRAAEQLTPDERLRLPVLSKTGADDTLWEPGSLLLVSRALDPLWHYCGRDPAYYSCVKLQVASTVMVIPAADVLASLENQ